VSGKILIFAHIYFIFLNFKKAGCGVSKWTCLFLFNAKY